MRQFRHSIRLDFPEDIIFPSSAYMLIGTERIFLECISRKWNLFLRNDCQETKIHNVTNYCYSHLFLYLDCFSHFWRCLHSRPRQSILQAYPLTVHLWICIYQLFSHKICLHWHHINLSWFSYVKLFSSVYVCENVFLWLLDEAIEV